MKKKIITLGLSLLFLSGLTACNSNESSSTSLTITSENPNTTTTTTTSVAEIKPSESLKLTTTVDTRSNFVDDGIGSATLVSPTDGDTATFSLTTKSSDNVETVRLRFQDIDTPESTGTVEKWGKAASLFTEEKLKAATSIILEAPSAGEKDSYGERYLGWVWYKTDSMTDYVNLNLEVVENGYSESKATGGHKYDLNFLQAQNYAKNHNLHIWSEDDDPYYNDNPVETTIAELIADLRSEDSKFYNKEAKVGSKITFNAYVKSVTVSSSGTYTYVAEELHDDGTKSTFNLYAGYSSDTINSVLYTGYLYHFVGTVQLYGSSYQIAIGGTYVALTTGEKYTYRLQKDYWMTFNSSNENLYKAKETSIRSNATVTAVNVEGDYLVVTADVFKKSSSETTQTESYTFKVPKPASYEKMVVGATFSVSGYQKTKDSKEIEVLSYSEISFK